MTGPRTYPEDSGPFDAAAEAATETPSDDKVFTSDDGIDRQDGETDPLEEAD